MKKSPPQYSDEVLQAEQALIRLAGNVPCVRCERRAAEQAGWFDGWCGECSARQMAEFAKSPHPAPVIHRPGPRLVATWGAAKPKAR